MTRQAPVRSRRHKSARTSARWKSGLMLTGLGAVVLGAGYIAGVNAPAVDASGSTGTASASGVIARSSSSAGTNQNQFLAPQTRNHSEDGQVFQFNGDDDGGFFGNQALPGENGTFEFNGGNGLGSNGQFNQQFGSRRSRQFGGLSQQQPNFGGPITRSRGS